VCVCVCVCCVCDRGKIILNTFLSGLPKTLMKAIATLIAILVVQNLLKSNAWLPSSRRLLLRSAQLNAEIRNPSSSPAGSSVIPKALEFPLGYFFEYDSSNSPVSQIECHLLHTARVNASEYALGAPVDMPVALCYFAGNEIKQVERSSKIFPALFERVQAELDENELVLFDTPVVMTLQGEFEDESLNNINPITLGDSTKSDEEEVSVSELIAAEAIDEGLDEPGYDELDDLEEDEEDEEDFEETEQEFIYSPALGVVERRNSKSVYFIAYTL
jgi:hypothetical protein